jgi:hypothetical protein
MIFGSIGFFCYASATSWLLMRFRPRTLTATIAMLPVWLGVSLGLVFLFSS